MKMNLELVTLSSECSGSLSWSKSNIPFQSSFETDSRLEGGVNRAKLKFTNINTTTSRVSVRIKCESEREGENKFQTNKSG